MAITMQFKDAIPTTEYRHYQLVNNADGTVSLIDKTTYEQVGTYLNAETLNTFVADLNESLTNVQAVIDGTKPLANAEKLNGQVGEYYIPTLHNLSITMDMWEENSYSYAIPSYDENMVIEIKGKSKADVELFNDSEIEYTESNGTIVFTCGTVPTDTLNLAIKVESVVKA